MSDFSFTDPHCRTRSEASFSDHGMFEPAAPIDDCGAPVVHTPMMARIDATALSPLISDSYLEGPVLFWRPQITTGHEPGWLGPDGPRRIGRRLHAQMAGRRGPSRSSPSVVGEKTATVVGSG